MEKEKISGIYKITNPEGQIYIGQSKNINERWVRKGFKSHPKLYESVLKHGWENHIHEVIEICECDKNILHAREKYWIKFYDTFDTHNGLNLQSGGLDCQVSQQTRKKQSEKKIGYKRSPETIEKIVKNLKRYDKDNPIPEETKRKISATVSKGLIGNTRTLGYRYSTERKIEINNKKRETRLKNENKYSYETGSKPVFNTETGLYYESIKEASKDTTYCYGHLVAMLNGAKKNITPFIYVK